MKFDFEPYKFELLYRPLYEFRIALAWALCAAASYACGLVIFSFPQKVLLIQSSLCAGMALLFLAKGWNLYKIHQSLYGSKLQLVPLDQFIDKAKPFIKADFIWLGEE